MISIINPSGRTRTDRTDRTDPDGPGRTRTDGRTDGRADGRTGQTGPIGICSKFKTGGVTSNSSEIHTVDDLLCSSDPNLNDACASRLQFLSLALNGGDAASKGQNHEWALAGFL